MRARFLRPLVKARAFGMTHRRNGFKLTHCRKLSGLLSFDWPRFVVNHTVLNDEKFHVAVLALCSGEQLPWFRARGVESARGSEGTRTHADRK